MGAGVGDSVEARLTRWGSCPVFNRATTALWRTAGGIGPCTPGRTQLTNKRTTPIIQRLVGIDRSSLGRWFPVFLAASRLLTVRAASPISAISFSH